MKAVIKIIVIYILRILMRVLFIFPIKNNRIVINSYSGRQYACNPKYISEYLQKNYPGKYEIIWAFEKPEKFAFLKECGIKTVKYASLKRFYYEATCKISINNIGSFSWFPIRKGQEHINTWHGGAGLKRCGLGEIANDDLMKKTLQMSGDGTTLMFSTSEKFEKYVCKNDLGYGGKVLRVGFPRNDIIFAATEGEQSTRKKICEKFNIPYDAFLLLYAPTWRYNTKMELVLPDFERLKQLIEQKSGKQVVVLSRMHHLSEYSVEYNDFIINATNYPDMQELLASVDFLITDYSGSIWDFAIRKKPIVLFTPDLEEYIQERGFHEEVREWGFPVCVTNDELVECVKNMSDETAMMNASKFMNSSKCFENGTACKQISEWIEKVCWGTVKI